MMNFKKLFQIIESNTAGAGGAFGIETDVTWSPEGSYIQYAPGDARIPGIIGVKKSKKKKNRKSKKSKILRRNARF